MRLQQPLSSFFLSLHLFHLFSPSPPRFYRKETQIGTPDWKYCIFQTTPQTGRPRDKDPGTRTQGLQTTLPHICTMHLCWKLKKKLPYIFKHGWYWPEASQAAKYIFLLLKMWCNLFRSVKKPVFYEKTKDIAVVSFHYMLDCIKDVSPCFQNASAWLPVLWV